MALSYHIAVDFMDMRDDGRLWTRVSDVRPGFVPIAGHYAIVGDEDADLLSRGSSRSTSRQASSSTCSTAAWRNTVTC